MIKIIKIVLGVILMGYFLRIAQDGDILVNQLKEMGWFGAAYIGVDILNVIDDAINRARSQND